jgi:pimeloyl-ACP methyl ester carboxylesterase
LRGKEICWWWCVGLLLAGFATTSSAQPESSVIDLQFCELRVPGTVLTASARCGTLEVPENPADPEGRQIALHIAVAQATGADAAPDPVFFFAGGPGQAAGDTWPMIRATFRQIRKTRDIVLIDQRGTGRSNALRCDVAEAAFEDEVPLSLVRSHTETCLAGLTGDPRFYTSTIAMTDIDRAREALGYEQINVVGGSYGSRTAQLYTRMYPDRVRTMTIDSVVPMDLPLGAEHSGNLDHSIRTVFSACRADARCDALFGADLDQLWDVIDALRESDARTGIVDPVTGEAVDTPLSADAVVLALRMLSYSSDTQALLPLLVSEAVRHNDFSRLTQQAMMVAADLGEMISSGMELSVMCAEDYPRFADYEPVVSARDTLMGEAFLERVIAACEVWPQGEVPADFGEPLTLDTPTLLLSGARDPVTPPRYADAVALGLMNSRHLIANGQGHSVMGIPCLRDAMTEFIAAGTVNAIDDSCLDTIQPAPFFESLTGPAP